MTTLALTIGNKSFNIETEFKENSAFQNLYHVEEAVGSPLTFGLRKFNQLFGDKIFELECENQIFKSVALKIVKLLLNVVLYPILGTFALTGILVNKIHLHIHNYKIQRRVKIAINKGQSVTCTSQRFANASNANPYKNTYNKSKSQTGAIDPNEISQIKSDGLGSFNKSVQKANSAGRFIKKVTLDYNRETGWMDSLKLRLEVIQHGPENQFLKNVIREHTLRLLHTGQIDLQALSTG